MADNIVLPKLSSTKETVSEFGVHPNQGFNLRHNINNNLSADAKIDFTGIADVVNKYRETFPVEAKIRAKTANNKFSTEIFYNNQGYQPNKGVSANYKDDNLNLNAKYTLNDAMGGRVHKNKSISGEYKGDKLNLGGQYSEFMLDGGPTFRS